MQQFKDTDVRKDMQFFKHFTEDQQETYLREYGENKFLSKVLESANIEVDESDLHKLKQKYNNLRISLEQTEMNFKRTKNIFEASFPVKKADENSMLTKISSIIENKKVELDNLKTTINQREKEQNPDKLEIPDEFYDILGSVMLNPYMDKYGNTLDYTTWETQLDPKNADKNGNNYNPFNREIMKIDEIEPNKTLRKEIQHFFQEKLAKLIEGEQFIEASELLEELGAPKEEFSNDQSIKQKLETLSAQIEKINDEDMKKALQEVISQQREEENRWFSYCSIV
jgi:hypothetical protein